MDEKPLRLRLVWTEPVPTEWQGQATEFGMQQGRDVVLPGVLQPEGTTTYETEAVAYTDSKGRLRYRGACIQGTPEEPFVYLSWRVTGCGSWVMRAKAMLSPLTEGFLAALTDGTTLQTSIRQMGHRPAGQIQVWIPV